MLTGIAQQPLHGSASTTADGQVVYTSDPTFAGTDRLRYSIVDARGDKATGEVFIGVMNRTEANLPPSANDDAYFLAGDPVETPLDVLSNDFDPESDPLQVVNVKALGLGDVEIDQFGRVVFVPPRSLPEETTMVFSYTIVDTAGNQDSAEIAVTMEAFNESLQPTPTPTPVVAVPTPTPTAVAQPTPTPDALPTPTPTPRPLSDNQPPVAVEDQRGPVKPGTRVDVEVLRNDFDPDGDREELRIVEVGRGATIEGSVVVIETGESTVTTTYTIEDADGARATGEIVVLVTENQPPLVGPLEVSTAYETEISLDLANQASDPDGDRLFFVCCTAIRGGSISDVEAAGDVLSLVFTPDDGFSGPAGFAYTVDDQHGHQVAGSVTVLVSPSGNQRPVALGDTIQVPQGSTVAVGLERLGTDPDPEDRLTFSIVERTGTGVDVDLDGTTVLVSAARDARPGSDGGFVYKVSDGTLDALGRVAIRVIESGNTPPLVTDTSIQLAAATSATVNLAVLTRESDPGDSVTWTATPPPGSKLAVALDGSRLQINAPAETVGRSEEVVFTATDTRGGKASGTITVTVVDPTAPPPVAVDDEARAQQRAVIEVRVLENDVDPLGKGLTLVSATSSQGTASVEGDRVRFLAAEGVARAVVRYTMRDASNRQASGTLIVETVGPPDQPAPIKVAVDAGQATLSWSTPQANGSPVTGYLLTKNGAESRQVDLRNSYTWTGLTNGSTYTFTVIAQSAAGDSLPSETSLPVIPNQVPEAPAPPTVDPIPGGSSLQIGWNAPRNDGSEILAYEVEIGGSTSGTIAVGTNRSHTWQGLTNGLEYTFRVRARNAAGFGPWSAPSSSEHPASPPGAPTIGAAERGTLSGSLTVNWSKPADGGSAIIEYEVRSSSRGSTTVSGADTTSYNWSNLPNGAEVSFEVRARNRAGWGPYSATSAGVAPCGVPGAPVITNVLRQDEHVHVSYSAPNANGCPITGYSITASSGAVQTTTASLHEFVGLINGTAYTFTVRANNVMGSGPASAPSSPVTPAGPPICASPGLGADATGPGTIALQWLDAIDNGSPITGYTISDGSTNRTSSGTDLTIGALANGTTYTYSVRATNDVGTSPACGSATVTTWDQPSPISASFGFVPALDELQAFVSGGVSPYTPIISWEARFINQTDSSEITANGSGGLPAVIARPAVTNGTYRLELSVCNVIGCATTTTCCEEVTLVAPPDRMDPPLMRYENTDWSRFGVDIRAAFTPPADNGAPITEYVWESRWHGDSNNWHYDVPGGRSPDLDVLVKFWPGYSSWPGSMNSGQDWVFSTRVAAVNSEGQAEWSDWAEVTAIARPPIVDMVTGSYSGCPGGPPALRCYQMEITVHGFAGDTVTSYWPDNAGTGGNGFYPSECTGRSFLTGPGGSFGGPVDCWFRADWAGELSVDVGGVRSVPFWIEPIEPPEICGGNTGIICK